MSEFIVSVPDEVAEYFIAMFGLDGTKMMGYDLTGEIVRCWDCKHYKETDSLARFNLTFCKFHFCKFHNGPREPNGYCAWVRRKRATMTSKPTLRDILLAILFWAFVIAMPFIGSLDAF